MSQPDSSRLAGVLGLEYPPIGFYDVPDIAPFQPVIKPSGCMFEHAHLWKEGTSIALSPTHIGCRGAGYWVCGVQSRTQEQLATFLHDEEGLKDSNDTISRWLDEHPGYKPAHGNIVIGPLHESQYDYLHTVTFLVTPDQLAMMITGAEYHNGEYAPLTRAPFGSGCMQFAPLTSSGEQPAAWISLTDMAMREHIPLTLIGFTVTKPMFEQLCALDNESFLGKRFWRDLQEARAIDNG